MAGGPNLGSSVFAGPHAGGSSRVQIDLAARGLSLLLIGVGWGLRESVAPTSLDSRDRADMLRT